MARVKPWLHNGLFTQLLQKNDIKLLIRNAILKDDVTQNLKFPIRCQVKQTKSNLVWVLKCPESEDFLEVTDGCTIVAAIISSETECEGSQDFEFENLQLELLEFDICVQLNTERSDPSLGLYLALKKIRARPDKRPVFTSILQPIWEKSNAVSLQGYLKRCLEAGVPQGPTDEPTTPDLGHGVHKTHDLLRHQPSQIASANMAHQQDSNGRSASATHSIDANADVNVDKRAEIPTPPQVQQWKDLTSQRRIPKYGSTPANTSKQQVELLQSDLAWDPPAPGRDKTKNYVPPKDFELLADLADNPDKYAQLEQAARSQQIAAQAIAIQADETTAANQQIESTDNSIIAHALQAKARMGTPDATALGASQWPPSPQQHVRQGEADHVPSSGMQKPLPNTDLQPVAENGQASTLRQSHDEFEDDDSLPEIDDDRLPSDSDENPLSPPPKSKKYSSSSQRANEPKATPVQLGLQHAVQVPDSNAKALPNAKAGVKTAVHLPKDRQQYAGQADDQGEARRNDGEAKANMGNPVDRILESVPATPAEPFVAPLDKGQESADDSDIEEQAPRGTNETPSSPIIITQREFPKKPIVQVDRSPQSDDKRSKVQPQTPFNLRPEQRSHGRPTSSNTTKASSNPIEVSSSKEASTSVYSSEKQSSSSRFRSSEARHPSSAKMPEVSASETLRNTHKRKRTASEGQGASHKKEKLAYRVVPSSPDFSQNLLAMANSTPAVTKARQEFSARFADGQLESSASKSKRVEASVSKPSKAHSVTGKTPQSHKETGSTRNSDNHPESRPTKVRQNKERSRPPHHGDLQREDLSNFEADVLEEQSMHHENAANSVSVGRNPGVTARKSAAQAQEHESSRRSPRETSSVNPSDLSFSDEPDLREVNPAELQFADNSMQVDDYEPVERAPVPARHTATVDLIDIDKSRSSSHHHPKIRKLVEASSRLASSVSPTPSTSLFAIFRSTYPKYCGDEKQFTAICKKLVQPKQQGSAIMKLFFDDFVGRYPTEYKLYSIRRIDEGETPDPYEQWFNDNVEATSFKRRILNESAISKYIAEAQSRQTNDGNNSSARASDRATSRSSVPNMLNESDFEPSMEDLHEIRSALKARREQRRSSKHSATSRRSDNTALPDNASRTVASDHIASPVSRLSVPKERKKSISPPSSRRSSKSTPASRIASSAAAASTMPPPQNNRPIREAARKTRRTSTGLDNLVDLLTARGHGEQDATTATLPSSDPIDLTMQDSSPAMTSPDEDDSYVPSPEPQSQHTTQTTSTTTASATRPVPRNDSPIITAVSTHHHHADHTNQAPQPQSLKKKKEPRRSLPWQLESGNTNTTTEDSTPPRPVVHERRRATIASHGTGIATGTSKPLRTRKSTTFSARPGTSKAAALAQQHRYMHSMSALGSSTSAGGGDGGGGGGDVRNSHAGPGVSRASMMMSSSSPAAAGSATRMKPYTRMLAEYQPEPPQTPTREEFDRDNGRKGKRVERF